jgi:hydrogenase nickel incorporation protein HypA/HybF
MHEGKLTEDLFEHVIIHAKEVKARRVTRIKVIIGALSDATADSISFYFSQLAPGTIVEGSELEFESKPGTGQCPNCGAEFEIEDLYASCPKCQSFPVRVTGGNGVYLASLELETDDEKHEHIHE